MAREIIPWHVFFEALSKQPNARLDEWLTKWCFDEEGAFLVGGPPKPENDRRRRLEKAFVELSILHSMSDRTVH
jgi:hypothetical protein